MRASLVTDKLLSLYIFQMVPATEPFVSLSARWLIHFSFYFLVSAAQLELWNSKGHHDRFWWLDIKSWLKKEKKDIDTLCVIWGIWSFAERNGSDQTFSAMIWTLSIFPNAYISQQCSIPVKLTAQTGCGGCQKSTVKRRCQWFGHYRMVFWCLNWRISITKI